MSFLERIRPAKEAEIRRLEEDFAQFAPKRPDHLPIRDFVSAVSGGDKLIAEIKHKSPSHPDFRQDIAPGRLAAIYQRHGAAALSIVTDQAHFGTSLTDITALHAATDLPVIAKDFILDPVQIQSAWAAGADAVLLIARMLDHDLMRRLMDEVRRLGLAALVECHDADDIAMALAVDARLIGINNRNLATLTTDLNHGGALVPLIPEGPVRISESGLNTRGDILTMTELGADAFLVGHALLLSPDPGRKVGELSGLLPTTGTRIKICGITNAHDARSAAFAGTDIIGLIFAASPRRINVMQALEIRQAVPRTRLCGVFMDQDLTMVAEDAITAGLDLIQLHGMESPGYCQELAALTGLPLIKALRPEQADPSFVKSYRAVTYFLIDLPKDRAADGPATGETTRAAALIRELGREVFLAGNLDPTNVADAIASAQPYAVDVCSGVEVSPGTKKPELIRAFVKEARS